MNYLKYTIILGFSTFFACNDYVELNPISQETSNNAYSSASQIEAALVGAYESFQSSEYYVWDNIVFQDIRSDNAYAGGDNPAIFEVDYLNVTPTNARLFTNWSNIYNAISKSNVVLQKLPLVSDPQFTEERREQMQGEALFLRSYHYFTLVKCFGGIPLILEPVNPNVDASVYVPKSSVEDVYAQLIEDLTTASDLLPDTYGNDASVNKARATSGAAHALLAKVYAQMPNPDYNQVINHINALESSEANYQLISYPALFDGTNYNNAESILEVQYLGGTEGTYGPQLLLPPSVSGDSWRKFATPSHDLINAYDAEGDVVRKNATILFEEVQWVDEFWGNAVGSTIPFGYKWKNASAWASADNVYLLRYGDLVLLKAEAYNYTGQLNNAIQEVNRIRNRVNLPNLTQEQSSNQEVMKATILNERRLELAYEAHRFDDLVRNNVVIETMNNLEEIDLRSGNEVNYNMTENKKLLPIPQQELDRNPQLAQNPL